ncbi:MAG: aminotransferase class V-fold PLP-dependent enzyme [Candidatus Eremiobacteraeota bacterium]|nr:aminotransferase class V-fold PLP-dependent enzyme [Candidatus Eremiobacteraeota bacterium]MCW5868999.1 aminotransferase class V-fold PLP-dependent enzyme [Candidatus Eremiobacteraeota bacterium]
MKLLNPGPVTLSERVRAALQKPDLCHREPEFLQMQRRIRDRLTDLYGCSQEYASVLLTGSGTAAVEAMVGSLVGPNDKPALVVANGVYGERMAAMLKRHGRHFEVVTSAWTEPMDLAGVAERISGCACVLAVHHETTTGRLNDLASLGKLCRQNQVPMLLDAVSSFGGEEILFEEWNLQACAATANKCLHGVPGVSFVVARRNALQAPGHSPALYLDLHNYYELQEKDGSPFTQAVQACYGLDEALAEIRDQGGWQARRDLYRRRAAQLEEGLARLGIDPFLREGRSSILGSYRLPPGVTYAQLHDRLKEAGFVIYAGQGGLSDEMFRIAVMGDLTRGDLERLLAAFPTE